MKYSLVTGASRGIGMALATECAKRRLNLILISLKNEGLPDVAWRLEKKYHIHVEFKETDLTEECNIDELYNWCVNEGYPVNMLVNNAGYSVQKFYAECSLADHKKSLKVNVEAVALMCARFLPLLKKHKRSYILNVGSIASFMHIPYKALYSASKNFVMALSNALNHELIDEGVFVTCLCPGPTITNSKVAQRTKAQGFKAKILTLPADKVARKGIEGVLKGKRIVIPGVFNKLLVFLTTSVPRSWSISIAGKIFDGKE